MFLEAYHLGIFTEGAGETAQKLRALAALAEDPGSVPSTHMAAQRSATPVPRDGMTSSQEKSIHMIKA